MIKSKINPMLTLEYIQTEPENKYFDRKSARVRPADLAPLISAFANAEGGTIVIGVDDKTRDIEGIAMVGPDRINDFINAPRDYCKPMPVSTWEYLEVTNHRGEPDRLLLIHVSPEQEQIIHTRKDETWLRIGDRSREIRGEDLRSLEYSRNTRRYEEECTLDAAIEDLDPRLLQRYKQILDAEALPTEQVLKARGLIRTVNGRERLTNAAVLLFAENIMQFYPNCRVRFVRYEGNVAGVGTRMNIVKDKSLDCCILRLIDKAKEYIETQLREFTALDGPTGTFRTVPEYPEFAWLEGIVNAIVHREYALMGDYILVAMYDDRLEIKSPGKLPNIVTVENIRHTRYARNPKISRVLTEFGYVRELNEGVRRIYSDMEAFFLEDPEYAEPGQQAVRLTLRNNIVMRQIRQTERVRKGIDSAIWEQLDDTERDILVLMGSRTRVTRAELMKHTGRSRRMVIDKLNHLIDLHVIKKNGKTRDPKQNYELL